MILHDPIPGISKKLISVRSRLYTTGSLLPVTQSPLCNGLPSNSWLLGDAHRVMVGMVTPEIKL